MRRLLLICALLVVGASAFSGCTPAATLPPSIIYAPPAGLDGTFGFIKGTELWTLVGSKPVVYPFAVGGKRIEAGVKGWGELLPVKPGRILLEVGFAYGVTNRTVTLDFPIAAGEICEIKFSGDPPGGFPNTFCDVWVESLTSGTAVSSIERIKLKP
jgi:hypothetical protein